MEEIVFIFDKKELILQCNINEKMKDILKRYSSEIKKDINSLYFTNNSEEIINQGIILSDFIKNNNNKNSNNKFCIIVKEITNEVIITQKNKDNDKITLKYKIDKNNNSIKIFGMNSLKIIKANAK